MAVKNSFAAVLENRLSRRFGGTVGTADPYSSGYGFIYFAKLPPALPEYTGFGSVQEIQNLLSGANTGVTPPGGTLNRTELPGLGGIKWAVPSNIDYGNSVTLKFLEFNGTPILNIMHGWVKMIRDYRTGAANLIDGNDGSGYSKRTYAGLLYYWTTCPDCKTVEFAAAYDGVFPTKDPQDLFTTDIETVGRVDIEVEFSLDYIWHEDWVKNKCQSLADSVYALKENVVNKYGENLA